MKKQLLFCAIIFHFGLISGQTTVISTSGNTFTPNSITINVGDTVDFQLSSSHDAREVSQSTWNSNGTTALPGFSVPFGGGIVTGLSVGVHYYVCTAHASMGMKGTITVSPISGIENELISDGINVVPNPTTGKFKIQYSTANVDINNIAVYNILGALVYSAPKEQLQTTKEIDLSTSEAGVYFVKIQIGEKNYTERVVVE